MIRAVIDTNILVRASIRPQGTVAPILWELRSGSYQLLYSDSLLKELVDVLGRPRLRTKYHPFEGIPIVGPAEFLARLRTS